jgi:hypothetical protein
MAFTGTGDADRAVDAFVRSITRKLSLKQSTGQTSTQSVCLHLMQLSVTTWVMRILKRERQSQDIELYRRDAARSP